MLGWTNLRRRSLQMRASVTVHFGSFHTNGLRPASSKINGHSGLAFPRLVSGFQHLVGGIGLGGEATGFYSKEGRFGKGAYVFPSMGIWKHFPIIFLI